MRWTGGRRSSNFEDRLQKRSRGYVTPDSFTHGSSAQRVRWFRQGLETGNVSQCNTLKAENL
ncbi:MAG: neutral zinc metallopeptidase [Desulfobacteraceae bacterium]|jgi:predicted metalloprotease|nr:neutral zinc metallopeptidase [Desulfobacteraceae bacterium]